MVEAQVNWAALVHVRKGNPDWRNTNLHSDLEMETQNLQDK